MLFRDSADTISHSSSALSSLELSMPFSKLSRRSRQRNKRNYKFSKTKTQSIIIYINSINIHLEKGK